MLFTSVGGYGILKRQNYRKSKKEQSMKKKKYAVFTMDVECFADTECIRSSGASVDTDMLDGFDEYMKLMDRYGIKNTLFTIGDLAEHIADRLRPCLAEGHDLALHSYNHVPPRAEQLERFREKTRQARERMKELFGVEVSGFRAPCFSMDNDRLEVLRELGFRYDSSYLHFYPAQHTRKLDMNGYQQLRPNVFRRGDFYEFGLPTGKILGYTFPIAGGGYVRLAPWLFIRDLLRRYIRQNDYYVFYIHPFELTRQKIPFIRQLKSYDQYYIRQGIRTYGKRVERIIKMLQRHGYEFVTFDQLTKILGKEQAA